MFEESPLYYICISLIFLIIFGSIAIATWLVWLTPAAFALKLTLTAFGVILAGLTVLLYTITVD
jgi:hypothetical protein